MSTRLFTTSEADAQILKAKTWWATNRPAAPGLLKEDLAKAFALLEEHPDAGVPKPRKRFPNLRWLPLLRTRYLLYYEYDKATNLVLVVSFRSAWRKRQRRIEGR